jgi:5,10-methylenetetrahydrofolate reductase
VEIFLKSLARSLASQSFTLTAEMFLRGQMPARKILDQAKELAPYVDGFQVGDDLQQKAQMSSLALAALLMRESIDPVTHLNCRDYNRLALQSDLVGLKALGVSSLILNRGEYLQNPETEIGKPVFDVSGHELISMAAEIGEETEEGPGKEFMIGTNTSVFAPKPDWKAETLKRRAKAGARFLQTQPCFNVPTLRRYMQRLVDLRLTWNFAVVVTLAILPGLETAGRQLESSHGIVIPKAIEKELAAAADPQKAGIEICARQMREIAAIPGVSGINLLSLASPAAVVAAIQESGLRARHRQAM